MWSHRKGSKNPKKPLGLRNYSILPKSSDLWTVKRQLQKVWLGHLQSGNSGKVNMWGELMEHELLQ